MAAYVPLSRCGTFTRVNEYSLWRMVHGSSGDAFFSILLERRIKTPADVLVTWSEAWKEKD